VRTRFSSIPTKKENEMSNIVWTAEAGWHDGESVEVAVDEAGHIVAVPA
jgi:hypothetical protein